jgi:UDP-glucose:(heptosyl)LPS alpha-1,3-glucosyltransferase
MKIAINIEAIGARRGGAEKYAGTVARWLIQAGHEVHVFARVVDEGELPAETPVHQVLPFCPPALGWFRAYLFASESERMLRRHQFDSIIGFNKVWYVNAYMAVGGAYPASLECNSQRFRSSVKRWVWWATKWISPKHWVFGAITRRQFRGAHCPHVIAPAHIVARHFEQYHGITTQRISVVYNALDSLASVADAPRVRERFRTRLGLSPDEVAVLFVARNYELKGLEPLLEAFAPVARRLPHARLVVSGSSRDGRFRRQAARLGLRDRVLFLGFVDDVRECFAGCDLFAFPTFYDPCSLVVLEAMNAGLPVITTRQNGAGELLTEGVDGFVIDRPWDLEQLSDRMQRIAGDAQLRRSLGERARINVRAYTLEARQQELLAAIERAAGDWWAKPTLRTAA